MSGVLTLFPFFGSLRPSGEGEPSSRNQNIKLDRKAAIRPTCVSEDT
jgi:hypothetical protein